MWKISVHFLLSLVTVFCFGNGIQCPKGLVDLVTEPSHVRSDRLFSKLSTPLILSEVEFHQIPSSSSQLFLFSTWVHFSGLVAPHMPRNSSSVVSLDMSKISVMLSGSGASSGLSDSLSLFCSPFYLLKQNKLFFKKCWQLCFLVLHLAKHQQDKLNNKFRCSRWFWTLLGPTFRTAVILQSLIGNVLLCS